MSENDKCGDSKCEMVINSLIISMCKRNEVMPYGAAERESAPSNWAC